MESLDKLIQLAKEKYDGHFTLMKFTTNWRCCFGTPFDTMYSVKYMAEGKTMGIAIKNCIDSNINYIDIDKIVQKELKENEEMPFYGL